MSKLYTDKNGNIPLTKEALYLIIKEADFLTSWTFVCTHIMHHINPNFELTPFHKTLMKFQADNMNSLIMAPRGFGKSYVCNTIWTLTQILRDSNVTMAIITSTQKQSLAFVKEIKDMLTSNVIVEIFGDLKGSKWSETGFTVKRDYVQKENTVDVGSFTASGNLISMHYKYIVLDDAVSFENSLTPGQRDKFKQFINNVVMPLRTTSKIKPDYGSIKAIGTFYNTEDWYAEKCKDKNGMFKVLRVKSIYKDPVTGEECSVCPEMKTIEILKQQRREMGTISFGMQYQMVCKLVGSKLFNSKHLHYFKDYYIKKDGNFYIKSENLEEKDSKLDIYIGVDLAISQKNDADDFVLTVIGVDRFHNRFYVLDVNGGKYSFNKQKELIKYYYNLYPVIRIGVESVGYQQAMLQELEEEGIPVYPIKTTKSKEARMAVLSAVWERDEISLYERLGDNGDKLIKQLYAFPNGTHDDFADSLMMAYETSLAYKFINTAPTSNIIDPTAFMI